MSNKSVISTGHQIALLIQEGVTHTGHAATITQVAEAVGISHQTLMNLVQGKSNNPRLSTLQALCELYGISMDYFTCTTEEACRYYLAQQQRTPLLAEIAEQSAKLSPKGQRNVLSLMEWIRVGKTAFLIQQQGKRHQHRSRTDH